MHAHLLLGHVLNRQDAATRQSISDGTDQALEEQLVDLRGEGLLQHREEGVGLAAHCHGQGEVLHAWSRECGEGGGNT